MNNVIKKIIRISVIIIISIILQITIIPNISNAFSFSEIFSKGQEWIEQGSEELTYTGPEGEETKIIDLDQTKLDSSIGSIYNVLLAGGIIIAVIVGGILGIQFMLASVEDKAKVKEALVPYIIGCVVVFGAFGIWKIVILVLNNI